MTFGKFDALSLLGVAVACFAAIADSKVKDEKMKIEITNQVHKALEKEAETTEEQTSTTEE